MNNWDKAKNMGNSEKNTEEINNINKSYKPFEFDVVSRGKIFAVIAGAVFILGIVSFFVFGFNWDIDFVGGTILEYNIGEDLSVSDVTKIENLVNATIGADMVSSVVRSGNPPQQIVIKTQVIESHQRNAIFEALAEEYGITEEAIFKADNVDPTVGSALTRRTILSVIIASGLMLLYVTFRFDFKSGLATVLCLLFDLFVMLTFYSILQIPMNVVVIAAFLTILAYSMNATIILFDRVRENVKLEKGRNTGFAAIVNKSVCQTVVRSINETITTFFVLILLFIIGVTSVQNFVLPLIVGIASGFFSSICLAGPLWNLFGGVKQGAGGR
jgi:preprotein translocase subunit SecF